MRVKAAILHEMGKPAPYAESKPLSIEEVELAGPGSGEVLVEIASAGLCHSDLSVIDGARPRVMPMVLGHEASGIVREAGAAVADFKAGDHVVFSFVPICGRCMSCATGRASMCENGAKANIAGTLLAGTRRFADRGGSALNHHLGVSGFAQFTVAAQESLVKIDPELPLAKAALFGCAVMTGVGAVLNAAQVAPGSSVAVFGLGGVGLSAVLGAQLAGAWPIVAVDLLESKLDLARKAGATHTVNAKRSDAVQAVRDLTGGGAQYAIESAGNERALAMAYESTRRGGMTVAVGIPHPDKRIALPPANLVTEERTLKGSYMGSAVPRRDIPRFLSLYKQGKLPVDVLYSKTIRLEEINAAFDALAKGETVRQMVEFT